MKSFFVHSDYNVGRFDCSVSPTLCHELYLVKRPNFILFKRGGHYEFYYGKESFDSRSDRCQIFIEGRQTSNDIAGFVRENAFSPLKTLTPSDFPSVKSDTKPFIIDYFSPVSLSLNDAENPQDERREDRLVLPTVYASSTRISQSIKTFE